MKKLSKVLGADYFRIKILNSFDKELLPKNSLYRFEVECRTPSAVKEVSSTGKKFICKEAMNSLVILWDGFVYPCCSLQGNHKPVSSYDEDLFPKKFPYNIFTDSVDEIWMDEEYFKLRFSFLKDSPIELCKICDNERLVKPRGSEIKIN